MFTSLHQKHVPAQTVSQGNRSTHARESYRSTNVWQTSFWMLWVRPQLTTML